MMYFLIIGRCPPSYRTLRDSYIIGSWIARPLRCAQADISRPPLHVFIRYCAEPLRMCLYKMMRVRPPKVKPTFFTRKSFIVAFAWYKDTRTLLGWDY